MSLVNQLLRRESNKQEEKNTQKLKPFNYLHHKYFKYDYGDFTFPIDK